MNKLCHYIIELVVNFCLEVYIIIAVIHIEREFNLHDSVFSLLVSK